MFRHWREPFLENCVELWAVQLPGREARIAEPFRTDFKLLISELIEVLTPLLDKPFAFFGYSMGGLIAFELASHLTEYHKRGPFHLIVGACNSAFRNKIRVPMTPESIMKTIQNLGGTPSEFFDEPGLIEATLPALQADFRLIQSYEYRPNQKLTCTITALAGIEDKEVTSENLNGWTGHSTEPVRIRLFPGGHFFIWSHEKTTMSVILSEVLSGLLKLNASARR